MYILLGITSKYGKLKSVSYVDELETCSKRNMDINKKKKEKKKKGRQAERKKEKKAIRLRELDENEKLKFVYLKLL